MRTPLALALLTCVAALASQGDAPEERVRAAAEALLATLDEAQAEALVFPFEGEERLRWNFVPMDRPGLHLGEMSDATRVALNRLLQTVLSSRGYLELHGILLLEEVLFDAERAQGRDGAMRDPGRYVVQMHGRPSAEQPWSFRLEGHHVSLNWTSVPGEQLSPAPFFLGAAPHEVQSGPRAGLRPLGKKEDLARRLLASLDEEQLARAWISRQKPRDVLFGPGRDEDLEGREGVPMFALTDNQRQMLLDLIDEYLSGLEETLWTRELMSIAEDGHEAIHFAWAGAREIGGDCYYRIHGPRFAIEFATQGDPNHVHTVYRDLEDDFGREILRRHYAAEHGGANDGGGR